ncbi:hypothetical protein HD806DRAFT_486730 [Xylariaceae sp. AK1471]|nr:hypothetical protein HD806DRAFT_486730 [Xylariaceae sp. AK1471]
MDSGSYNHVRRGAMPHSSVSPSTPTSSYKTNVNRTKTRKWVEAKVQNYDGDDWGNDYEDYDDGSDQHYEPEPLPPARSTTGLRQPGQTGYQLPSSRTFSQPATSFPSHADTRIPGASALRSPSGPPSLHVQTQPTASTTNSSLYVTKSAHPESHPTTTSSPHTNVHPNSQSAGPAPTPSRFPPRKSSMGQQDRPELVDQLPPKPESRPGSSSSNRPWMDQRSASPGLATTPAAKTLPFVRPSDIYKRMEEEKEKERLSMESGRSSMDSVLGRTEGTSSPGQVRLSGEQRRRTSFESHDGSESARGRKPTLAPVAERKSEYGMEGLLAKAQAEQPPVSHKPALSKAQLSLSQREPDDEVKAELLKSRRFSTSPQLPSLTRVSGFGDDFFSSSEGHSSQTSLNLPTPSEEPRPLSTKMSVHPTKAAAMDRTEKQRPSTSEQLSLMPNANIKLPTTDEKVEAAKEETMKKTWQQSNARPKLPGGWVTESTTVPSPYEQPTPLERQEAQGPTPLAEVKNVGVSPMTESDTELGDLQLTTKIKSLQSSSDASENTPKADVAGRPDAGQSGNAAGQNDAIASKAVNTGEYFPTTQSLPPLKTEHSLPQPSRPTSTTAPTFQDKSPQTQASSTPQPTTATGSGFSPTAPLNPNRADAGRPNIALPSIHQRKSTISTIETVSPEKESDKLREEIIKSLSPAPISPGASGLPMPSDTNTEPTPGDITRESTYLAGVYDDYLSLAEEKSLQEVSQEAKKSAHMAPSQITEPEHGSIPELKLSVSQPAPLSPVKSPTLDNTSRTRRFSWQKGPEEVVLSPVGAESAMSTLSQESPVYSSGGLNSGLNSKVNVAPLASDSLRAETGGVVAISHQVSQVSSRAPEDASLSAIEPPSPLSFMAARSPKPASGGPNTSRLSLADEKEKVLIGDSQSTTSSTSEQHPALTKAPEQEDHGSSPVGVAEGVSTSQPSPIPTPFRDILNLGSYEQRIQKFDETREQFYVTDSGLSNWLIHLQGQPEHANAVATSNTQTLLSKPGAQPVSAGASGASQLPFNVSKAGAPALQHRRTSMGNVQQLMVGQSGSFGAPGNQVGTKSKELLHAAGAFGNKGVKSGMKLFNKGKNKLRERTGGDKPFF